VKVINHDGDEVRFQVYEFDRFAAQPVVVSGTFTRPQSDVTRDWRGTTSRQLSARMA
jgi:hypothetical protein